MSDSTLQSLLSTKAALDLGLITQSDFDSVKSAFLRSQQIKAAVDTGLIRSEDYESVKQQYLSSLEGVAPAASHAVAAAPQTVQQRSAPAPAMAAAPAAAMAQQTQPAPKAAPPAPAPPPAAPAPVAPAPVPRAVPTCNGSAAAPAAAAAAGAASGDHGNNSSSVPTNIPRMGGVKPKSGGVSNAEGQAVWVFQNTPRSALQWELTSCVINNGFNTPAASRTVVQERQGMARAAAGPDQGRE